jgi:hypothetical protein
MIEDCKQLLSTRAAEWGLPTVGEWNLLFHNNYQPTCSTINLLWFYQSEEFPRVVTKMYRDHSVLAQEFQSLQAVYPLASRYVPRPMHLGKADGFGMLWMEGVPGRRIPPGGRYPASVLAESVDMLVSIHRAVNKGTEQADVDRHARMIAAPLDVVLEFCGPTVRDGCLALLETATPEWLRTLPAIPQHGDLFIDNILRHRDESHIVDWDSFGELDLPYHDLITLLLSFLQASSSAPEQWNPALKRQMPSLVERYTCGLQLPASTLSVLLPLTLANQLYLHCQTVERRLCTEYALSPAQLRMHLAERRADVPLIEFVRAIEGRGAAMIMYAALEHYFEHPAYWQEVFLGK